MISRREFLLDSLAAGGGLAAFSNRAGAFEAQKILELAGTKAPSAGSYTRMFPHLPPQGANNPHLEEGLIELGEHMIDDTNERPPQLGKLAPAGYTYLGQFIDHDLTFDILPLQAARRGLEHRQNYRTPFLDLDQLYGGGPTLSPFLYRNARQDIGKESFLIGRTASPSGPTPTPTPTPTSTSEGTLGDDLPRNSEGIALVGDPRQDENLIIAQLHVAFLRIHNSVLRKLENGELKSCGPAGATCFQQARRLATWHYQWVVYKDYLKRILDENVYKEITNPKYQPKMAAVSGDFRIPIEFSGAAFRFGHSMVRNVYEINSNHHDVSLKTLLSLTGIGGEARPRLPAEWKVDWPKFFAAGGGEMTVRASNPIDTRIAAGLYQLSKDSKGDLKSLFEVTMPGDTARCNPPTPNRGEDDLPVITLLRGARMKLPSGQAVAKTLGVKPLTDDEVLKDNPHASHEKILMKYSFVRDTPLWYYILKEAEIRGDGCRLGPIGSKIVGDVLVSSLRRDPDSYLSVDASEPYQPWKPTLPVCRHDPELFEMSDLIRFSIDPDWGTKQPCP
jgi:hypothetical protein